MDAFIVLHLAQREQIRLLQISNKHYDSILKVMPKSNNLQIYFFSIWNSYKLANVRLKHRKCANENASFSVKKSN